jgi:hypothetical protein
MASDGSSSGEKSVVMKKVHHLNPRRRNKVKGKLPEKDLTEEEKRRRNEQKKRRVGATAAAVAAGLDCR